jgi:hypothetical protein
VDHDIGVGGGTDLPFDRFVVGQRVAIGAEQGVAGFSLQFELIGVGEALFEVHLAIVKVEQADHAVAVEELVVGEFGGELVVGMHAVKGAVHGGGDLALDLHVQNVAFHADGAQNAGKAAGVGEMGHGVHPLVWRLWVAPFCM